MIAPILDVIIQVQSNGQVKTGRYCLHCLREKGMFAVGTETRLVIKLAKGNQKPGERT